ncbi:MAG: ATP-binding protein, partial [Firmicutes bacterium]|nr:ATP-binding protein [Bacillota bacterium]
MSDYTLLRDISLIWSLFHVLILFIAFYESRYPRRKTFILTGIFMGGLLILISVLIFIKGALWVSNAAILICTLPSLIFFYIMS